MRDEAFLNEVLQDKTSRDELRNFGTLKTSLNIATLASILASLIIGGVIGDGYAKGIQPDYPDTDMSPAGIFIGVVVGGVVGWIATTVLFSPIRILLDMRNHVYEAGTNLIQVKNEVKGLRAQLLIAEAKMFPPKPEEEESTPDTPESS